MRASSFNASPEGKERGHIHASVDDARRGGPTQRVANVTIDAMIVDRVSSSDRVDVVGKRSILDTATRAGTIAAESKDGVEQDGL